MVDWHDALHRTEREQPPSNGLGTVSPIDPIRGSRYAQAALAREIETVATARQGTRNDTLNRAGFNLAQLVAAGHIEEAYVRGGLTYAAKAAGLEDGEIANTLASSLGAGGKLPRVVADLPAPPQVTTLTSPTEGVTIADQPSEDGTHGCGNGDGSSVRERFPIIDWRALWEADDDEEWIIEPLLPARRLVALFSAPKVGKSLLMLEVAVGVALGVGYRPDRPRRVLYVDFENDPRGDVRQRLQAMGYKPDDLDGLCYLSFPRLAKLDTAFGGIDLMAAVVEYGCEVVVIDTISRAVAGEENENDTWLNFYRFTGMALKAAGVSCIRLDHTGKDADKGMRGGSAKYGDVDAVWKLSGVTDTTYRLDCTDHRLPIAEKTIVVERRKLPTLHHAVQAEGRVAAKRAQVEEIITALDQIGAPLDITRRGAKEALSTTGVRARDTTYLEALNERRKRHQITPIGDDD